MEDRLPIYEIESELVRQFRAQGRLLLSAPTGSGKSTQVPQMLLKHGLLGEGQVVILQPRRLATRLLAVRVAGELGVQPGREVGYQIRFENCSGRETRIKYVTEGVLLRQMVQDPSLPGVSTLIFDEFHERHLYGDITLARALDLQASNRTGLRILVMSATLDMDRLHAYLNPCAVLRSEGRMFPVEVRYARDPAYADRRPVWDQAAEAFDAWAVAGGRGDVLIFMPGSFEIQQTLNAIRQLDSSKGRMLLPLHGELPPRDQDAAVARHERSKVVVATNVAETSLTIDGIRLVIDSGLARIPRYDPHRGINTLWVERISQASADQRAGRAGRTAPGICQRLWSEREHAEREVQEQPEVKRLDLAEVVLTLKASGVGDLRKFRWLEAPDEHALGDAEDLLVDLGALVVDGDSRVTLPSGSKAATRITPLGRQMLAFPMHPRYSRMLLAAQEHGCVYQAALIAALTQGRELFLRNVDRDTRSAREDLLGEKATSDFWILMRAWNYAVRNDFRLEACRRLGIHAVTARQVGPLLQHLLRIAEGEGLSVEPREVEDAAVQKCVLIGFSDRVARRVDQGTLRCEMVHGRSGLLVRESVVQQSPLLVVADVREVGGRDGDVSTLFSLATAIQSEWLAELFPADISKVPRVQFDATARRVVAAELTRFRDLPLEARRVEPPPAEEAGRMLAEEVLAGRLVLKEWDHAVEQWIIRLNLLSRWCPELSLPPINEEGRRHLIEQICHGSVGYKELKDKPVHPVVHSWLSAEQRNLLDRHAPERLLLSNGRNPKVNYDPSNPPHISLRIQELYDVRQTPRIAMGRVPVVVHILAPSMRPVQVTQDLGGFWSDHYPRIKQELQRKYPKHEWR